MDTNSDQRTESERDFHDLRYGEEVDLRSGLDRWYRAVDSGRRLQDAMLMQLAYGRDVLEIGSADGTYSLDETTLASLPRTFHGIDISGRAVEKAATKAAIRGYTRARYSVMNAEHTEFPTASFDLVYGRGILHHLDLEASYRELARLLRHGGKALFYEPMGHNPLLNWYRRRTPGMRTPDEHPMLMRDFDHARRHFRSVRIHHYGLFTLGVVPLGESAFGVTMMRAMERVDAVALELPGLRSQSWFALMEMQT